MKWLCLLLFGGIGLAAFAGGVMWGLKRYKLMSGGTRAQGAVVELEESRSSKSRAVYPVVEFAAAGKTYRFRGSTGSSSPSYEVGQTVPVVYDPAGPHDAQIADFEQFWLGPAVLSLFGFLFLAAGIGGFFLVQSSDETFGPAFQQRMARAELFDMKRGVALEAVVTGVQKEGGSWKLTCKGGLPGAEKREFTALLALDPGRVLGKAVTVYADARDAQRYYVHAEPLLQAER